MFIMMSGLADAIRFPTIEDRIGETMRTSGVAITITSMTDLLAFCVGATSVFPGITTFCIYTGKLRLLTRLCHVDQLVPKLLFLVTYEENLLLLVQYLFFYHKI